MEPSRKIVGLVLGHGKARDQILKHIPVWKQTCDELLFFTPVDDRLNIGYPEYSVGTSGRYDAQTNLRCREALRIGGMLDTDCVMLIEWDSFCWQIPGWPKPDEVMAPQFWEPQVGLKFKGSYYLHFPQLFSRSAAIATVAAMDKLPLDAEFGFTDRYVGYAVEQAACVKVDDLIKKGRVYTLNHITAADVPAAVAAIKAGAIWHHGIKDDFVLQALITAHELHTP